MPSETEILARHLVVALHKATKGQPQAWRSIGGLAGVSDATIKFGVDKGWLLVEGDHSVCLTDAGRRLAKS